MHKSIFTVALAATLIFSQKVKANDIAVFDVRKPVALSDAEKVYKDYYINAGTEVGIKRGYMINVTRSKSLYDNYSNKSPGDLIIPVGRLQIIYSQKGLSVGRLHSLYSRKDLPVIDYNYIMIGDRVDINSLTKIKKTSENVKPKPVKSTAKETKKVEGSVDFASSLPNPPEGILLPTMQ